MSKKNYKDILSLIYIISEKQKYFKTNKIKNSLSNQKERYYR